MSSPFLSTFAVVAVACWTSIACGAEPWADQRLPVREGLQLWLDAAAQPAARKARELPELANAGRLDVWLDGSGRHRDLAAPTDSARPEWATVGNNPVVRFDGEDDHLRITGLEEQLDSMTVFLVLVPHGNLGGFQAFMAFNAAGQRDWMSGLTIDQTGVPGVAFSQVNVEGRGFLGAQNLMTNSAPFGTAHVLAIRSDTREQSLSLAVDGEKPNSRPRDGSPISMEEITIGARFYTNEPGEQLVRGWGRSDIAEVIVYDRALSPDEMKSVQEYLETRHQDLKAAALPHSGSLLVTVENPPEVQVLIPGFEVRSIPLDLPNINNLRSRPDGKILALAYNGDMHLLSDTDNDGLPDRADLFWDNQGRLRAPIGMTLTPPGYAHGQGAFVAAKGKCSLIVDTDGDDVADKEIIVAEGWEEIPHGVDALGTAVDPRDQSVYFGIGVTNFTNAYELDGKGGSRYSLSGERGTILKVAPDFQSREIVCTGIRFPVAMAFSPDGELFVSDQEGATWLANGNPLDELLHIERGRHYGFPPRHPKWLPDVIDEPSVYDYGPQHQSTCGLIFNEPVLPDGPVFGPADWRGDAIVAGYSRGKIYRTKLVRTPAGYVAENHLLACLQELTVDTCVDREGGLLVATHSGGPDWGSGPGGNGRLYKITYRAPDVPQPVAAWSSGPDEMRIAFDRPLDAERLKGITSLTSIQDGGSVRAGDRFETLRPGYAAVGAQIIAPRADRAARSVQLSSDGRTLMVITEPAAARVPHAVTLPASAFGAVQSASSGVIEQHSQVDLDYDLTGAAVQWAAQEGNARWSGWWPHLNSDVARQLTKGSSEHDRLRSQYSEPGTLTLSAIVDLKNMLRPEVQPGMKIDYSWPDETVTLTFKASGPVALECQEGLAETDPQDPTLVRLTVVKPDKPFPVQLTIKSAGKPELEVTWSTAEDARPRALPLRRTFVPWSEDPRADASQLAHCRPAELEGGSWARGRKVFFGEAAGCFKCHSVHGKGGLAAPNLSNLVHRDYASVMRDINEPSFAINPDYASYIVEDTAGRVYSGTLRNVGEALHITDTNGKEQIVPRSEIERIIPGKTSTMPTGIPKQVTPDQMKDLLTFLLTPPPQMPQDGPGSAPPPRKRADVDAVLAGAAELRPESRVLKVTLVSGPKDHGPGEHDYPAWQTAWQELLGVMDQTEVSTAHIWPSAEQLQNSDVLVFYQQGDWTTERARDVDAFLARGGGLVYIHYAVDGGRQAPEFAKRIGLAWQGGASKFRHGPLDLIFNRGSKHPIARNFDGLHLVDESYWQLMGALPGDQVLATGVEDGEPQPLFWTNEPGNGRVFVSIPGHYSWSFDDPLFRVLLLRGIAWTAKEDVDRFNEAVWIGSRVMD